MVLLTSDIAPQVGRAIRIDGPDKVTGATRYTGDLKRPGMLFGKPLRSPYPHARILSIETAAARALPGVHAVLTGADIPADVRVGRNMRDIHVLAREKVRFVGDKVAAVAADSLAVAEQALRLIEVEYEELPAVYDPLDAMRPDAPLIHDPAVVRAWAEPAQVVPEYPNGVSAPSWGASLAEVEQALAEADSVFEHRFRTPIQHHAYLEPHACLVELDEQGVAHIWATNKAPLLLTRYLELGLGLKRDQVAIHMQPVGGDFGGKGSLMDIPLAYYLARASGRPVRIAMTYPEELQAGNPRHGSVIVVRSGVNTEGHIVAQWLRGYFGSGGYAAFKPDTTTTLPGFKRGATGPYHVPVHRSECHMIYTNTVPCGNMRSPGEAQTAYALECHMELMARELGVDPVAFRLKNGAIHARPEEGDGPGVLPRVREVLEAAAAAIGLSEPREDGIGRGIGLVEFSTTPGVYSGILRVDGDGHVTLQTPIIENGAGMLTVFKQIVAEEFGISVDQVTVEQSLEGIEDDRGVGGSRVTRMVGKLLLVLTRRVKDRLAGLLAGEYGLDRTAIEAFPGGFRLPDGRLFTFAQAASLAAETIVEHELFKAQPKDRSVVFMVQAAEVAVDRETGKVTPRRLVSVHEVGRVVDPLLFKVQIEGGVLQGVGYALTEEIVVQDGRVSNLNLHEYKIPTVLDAPEVEAILLEPDLRLGFTPVGEGPNAGMPAAIVNAVVDVVGPYPFDIPLSPDVVRRVAAGKGGYTSGRIR